MRIVVMHSRKLVEHNSPLFFSLLLPQGVSVHISRCMITDAYFCILFIYIFGVTIEHYERFLIANRI